MPGAPKHIGDGAAYSGGGEGLSHRSRGGDIRGWGRRDALGGDREGRPGGRGRVGGVLEQHRGAGVQGGARGGGVLERGGAGSGASWRRRSVGGYRGGGAGRGYPGPGQCCPDHRGPQPCRASVCRAGRALGLEPAPLLPVGQVLAEGSERSFRPRCEGCPPSELLSPGSIQLEGGPLTAGCGLRPRAAPAALGPPGIQRASFPTLRRVGRLPPAGGRGPAAHPPESP